MIVHLEEGRQCADRLVALGCTFALHDFGTGYASLTCLRELPITYVKIDGRFVNGIAIVQMARTLGKTTIAEGIEDEQTLNKLRTFGVDLGQGSSSGDPVHSSRLARDSDPLRGQKRALEATTAVGANRWAEVSRRL